MWQGAQRGAPVLSFDQLRQLALSGGGQAIVGSQRSLLWLLLGGVAVLLLIACANTAQLLLARSLRRAREVTIRAALGASRTRLIRQFLLEGLVLAACGGVIGLLVSGWITRLLVRLLPVRSPILESAHPDMRLFGFTLAVLVISAIAFAIVQNLVVAKGCHRRSIEIVFGFDVVVVVFGNLQELRAARTHVRHGCENFGA